jgi:hypothetical protein
MLNHAILVVSLITEVIRDTRRTTEFIWFKYDSVTCNIPPPQGRAHLYLAAFLGHRLPSQTNTSLFLHTLSSLVSTREELPGRSPITPGQARLTLEFFRDGLPEKKLQLVGKSILLILLSTGPRCYITVPVMAVILELL